MTEPSPALTRFSLDGADADASDCAAFLANQSPLDGQAAAWLVRRQDGLCAEEERAFQAWLALDPSHPAALVRLQGVWGRIDALPSESVALLKASVEAARSAPAASPSTAREARQPTQPSHRPGPSARPGGLFGLFGLGRRGASFLPQMASVAVAFAVVGGTWFAWNHWQQQPVFTQTYATARGQQLDVRLPDGTAMKLDTGTRAEVTLYRQRREVRLPQGQALFSVKSDAKQPFSVWAGPLRITVVGTRFSVRNTATGLMSEGASVVVEEGRVRVSTAGVGAGAAAHGSQQAASTGAVDLVAGQSIQADAAGQLGPVESQAQRDALGWREGRVDFERTPLTRALAEFERYGPTRLVINDAAVGAMRVNGSFSLRESDAFAKALPRVLPVRLVARDGVTEVVATRP